MGGRTVAVIVAAIVLVVGGVVAAVALTAGDDGDKDSASGDNGGSSTSGNASVEEFCAPYQDYIDSFLDVDFSAPEEEQVQTMVGAIKDYAAALADVGVPEDMPDEAREGRDFLIGWADDLNPDDFTSIEDFESFEDDFSEDEDAAGEAFFEYVEATCGGDPAEPEPTSTESPTELPSDLGTALPSEIPTDFLSEIPSEYLTMLPSDFPTDFLSEIPSEYLTMLPSDLLTMLPSE